MHYVINFFRVKTAIKIIKEMKFGKQIKKNIKMKELEE